MLLWKKSQKNINRISNSRLNLIIAIIFLLAGLIIFKLFDLQILNHELYYDLASSQHRAFSLLEPERGRIFIQDNAAGSPGRLYPIATNKVFHLLFAVPKDMAGGAEAERISKALYAVFKQAKAEKEVDEMLKREEDKRLSSQIKALGSLGDEDKRAKAVSLKVEHEKLMADKEYGLIRQARREEEINSRKQNILEAYLKKLNKIDDVYEPLEQKVEESVLKSFYLALNPVGAGITPDDLTLENNAMFIINHGDKKELAVAGLGFSKSLYRYYPENNIGANLIGFVGYVGDKQQGRYGLEEYFDQELSGSPGSVKAERDATGKAIILNDREYLKPENGADLILTINRSVQFIACKKLNEAVLRHGADGGSVIIMDPESGAVLAMCSAPDYDANNYQDVGNIKNFINPAIFSQYEPGSIFKVITMAMSLDQEKVTPQTIYEDTGRVVIDNYTIENSDRQTNGRQTMMDVLGKSLNTGAIFVMRQIGPDLFADYVKKFGFGEKTGFESAGEGKGDIKNLLKKPVRELNAATASFGQGIAVTPLQMVSAFQAIANKGILMKPYAVKEIIKPDGERVVTQPAALRRVISEKAASFAGAMMVEVVENGHGKRAAVPGYWVGGKTGTAQVPRTDGKGYESNNHIGSFAGFAPVDDPKFVMLVRIDRPRDVEWAESSAAPLFGEIAAYMLNYWQVAKER